MHWCITQDTSIKQKTSEDYVLPDTRICGPSACRSGVMSAAAPSCWGSWASAGGVSLHACLSSSVSVHTNLLIPFLRIWLPDDERGQRIRCKDATHVEASLVLYCRLCLRVVFNLFLIYTAKQNETLLFEYARTWKGGGWESGRKKNKNGPIHVFLVPIRFPFPTSKTATDYKSSFNFIFNIMYNIYVEIIHI